MPKFSNCLDDTCSDEIVVELVAAIDACTATLGGLSGGISTTALVTVVADVVTVRSGEFLGLNSLLTHRVRKSLSASTTTRRIVVAIALI